MPQFIADQIRVNHDPARPKEGSGASQPSAVRRVDFRRTEETIRMLTLAFPWKETTEGEAFWYDIVKRLARIKDRGQ